MSLIARYRGVFPVIWSRSNADRGKPYSVMRMPVSGLEIEQCSIWHRRQKIMNCGTVFIKNLAWIFGWP